MSRYPFFPKPFPPASMSSIFPDRPTGPRPGSSEPPESSMSKAELARELMAELARQTVSSPQTREAVDAINARFSEIGDIAASVLPESKRAEFVNQIRSTASVITSTLIVIAS